jgi:type II secretory pathway component PulM
MSASPINVNKKSSFAGLAGLRTRWEQIEPRTRTVLLISAGALLAGLIYAYVWLPAARGRVLNAERIPVLEAKLANMRAQVAEMQRLNAVPPATSTTTTSARGAADVAGLQTIFGSSAKIAVDENRAFRINIASMSYTSFLDRLDQALSRYRLGVDSLAITALSSPISAPAASANTNANTKTNPPAMVSIDVALIDGATSTTRPNKP